MPSRDVKLKFQDHLQNQNGIIYISPIWVRKCSGDMYQSLYFLRPVLIKTQNRSAVAQTLIKVTVGTAISIPAQNACWKIFWHLALTVLLEARKWIALEKLSKISTVAIMPGQLKCISKL